LVITPWKAQHSYVGSLRDRNSQPAGNSSESPVLWTSATRNLAAPALHFRRGKQPCHSRPEAQRAELAGLIPEAERRLESLRQATVRSTGRLEGPQASQGMVAKQVSNALRALLKPSMLFALLSLTVRKPALVLLSCGMLLRRCMVLKIRRAFLQTQVGCGKRSSAIKFSESHYADLSARDG
jgi:hypothetical protein